jgi:hypothetical protein
MTTDRPSAGTTTTEGTTTKHGARLAHGARIRGRSGRKGGDHMLFHEHPERTFAALHQASLMRASRDARLIRSPRSPRRAIRRALGQSLIGIGHRLAAEHGIQPARSR